MEIGVWIVATEYTIDPVILARRAEELGFNSFWAPEEVAVPVKLETGWRFVPGERLPEEYYGMVDPFVSLARVAAATKTIKLGTGICQVPQRNPIVLAKEIATLDYYSGGRFVFGIGATWIREEAEVMGVDFERRWGQTREAVAAMKELWTQEQAEFHGTHYDFPPLRSRPKPAQKPHPPVLIGSGSPNVFKRIVAWGDGWLPSGWPAREYMPPAQVKAARTKLDELAEAAGRDPESISITVFGMESELELVEAHEEAGADEVVIPIPSLPEEEALEELERIARRALK